MFRTARRAVVTAAAALLPAAVLVPAAQADLKTFPDVGSYITGVRVSHGPKAIAVTAYDKEMTFTTSYQFWLDTDPEDPGAEYRVDVFPNSEIVPLQKVTNFDSPGKDLKCSGLRVVADASDGDETPYTKVTVPRSCLGTPNKVRVSVVGYYTDPTVVDWAPGEKKFYPWVNR